MALFGKKALTVDEIIKGLETLSAEDKEKVKATLADVDKAEDEREIDKVEEEKADTSEIADEKAEEVNDETAEIEKDVDELKEENANDGEETELTGEDDKPLDTNTDDEPVTEENPEENTNGNLDEVEQENAEDATKALADRISAVEEVVAKIDIDKLGDLITKLESINEKHKNDIGYKGSMPNEKKSYGEMSAEELARELAIEY